MLTLILQVIAADPDGSILANPSCKETHTYEVEGIGYGQTIQPEPEQ
jgi:cysteine synthase